jgi:3'-phosphoadenosine 5'-phosphosulfate sulfotransferase (PAPS reductase)/FAD synthetase
MSKGIEMSLDDRIAQAHSIYKNALDRWNPPVAMILYSSGNDSTALLSLFASRIPLAAHCNTGTGVEEAFEFAQQMCKKYGAELIVDAADEKDSYETIVREHGFPGPGQHGTIYRRIKERALRKIKKRYPIARLTKYLFVTGVRASESARRAGYKCVEKVEGNIVWLNPLYYWTDDDMAAYRQQYRVPFNPVSKVLGISGECLCGCYAQPDELDKLRLNFPRAAARIDRWAGIAAAHGKPCVWGKAPASTDNKACGNNVGALCAGCG